MTSDRVLWRGALRALDDLHDWPWDEDTEVALVTAAHLDALTEASLCRCGDALSVDTGALCGNCQAAYAPAPTNEEPA